VSTFRGNFRQAGRARGPRSGRNSLSAVERRFVRAGHEGLQLMRQSLGRGTEIDTCRAA
jgi:hypothetical protein